MSLFTIDLSDSCGEQASPISSNSGSASDSTSDQPYFIIDTSNAKDTDEFVMKSDISVRFPSPSWRSYATVREIHRRFNGKSVFFSFLDSNCHLLSAKAKLNVENYIPITKSQNPRFSEPSEYVLAIENCGRDFSLRRDSINGAEIMKVRFFAGRNGNILIRKTVVSFYSNGQKASLALKTQSPRIQNGRAVFDFEDRFSIQSVKNVVLCDQSDGKKSVFVRKISKDVLETDSRLNIDPVFAFAITISCSICTFQF